ncbi:MAG: NUDIX domain-containing protein [Chloroflexi bacterium]|nr:NUDIX domain-containing protein [Chloroflexota bacterium]MCI0575222.1 NUDIX domain-containing protein [Chloroflexota bacterium]MCI0643818.1 NUDIX domain-containing protein [Chloroflexota bacterium]MCI0726084.1 NUDIX domain-containing protein [Chloroflexota bacterium]
MGRNDQGVRGGRPRYQAIPRVLVFLRHGPDVLLLQGAPDKRLWANLYNGVGGHVEAAEDVYTAASREVTEETGLVVSDLSLKAVVNIDAGEPDAGILMFVFTGWSQRRQFKPSAEGELRWVPADQVSRYELVEDLAWLLPRVLAMPPDAPPLFLHYGYDSADRLVIQSAELPESNIRIQ